MTNYFSYFPPDPAAGGWEFSATALGRTRIPPDSPYPPRDRRHPASHHFEWERGRRLDAFQLFLIAEGSGEFQSEATAPVTLAAGSLVILLPGVWHRYRPHRWTGWVEHWLEFRGRLFQGWREAGRLREDQPVRRVGDAGDALALFDEAHRVGSARRVGFEVVLGAIAVRLLLLGLLPLPRTGLPPRPIDAAIPRAQSLLWHRLAEPVAFPELAAELGVSYSYFRREFRRRTGLSPKAYLDSLRLRRARDLLAVSAEPIAEVGRRVGFENAFHFSRWFRLRTGLAPSRFRAACGG